MDNSGFPLFYGLRAVMSWAASRNVVKRGNTPPSRLQSLCTKGFQQDRGGLVIPIEGYFVARAAIGEQLEVYPYTLS